ncbi:hypothetical protein [Streptomyces sp. NPDC007264]|uniref:hypothetical protein n=1 Tax=Streptomyces sp. NPDC007264 TaxID=3364777 RepID=UPI0036DB16B9
MTSKSVHGAYPEQDQDEQYPLIGYGHPKDRRVDLKQVQAGLAVSADGGISVHARVFGGGAARAFRLWVEVGLRGHTADGLPRPGWSGRTTPRSAGSPTPDATGPSTSRPGPRT